VALCGSGEFGVVAARIKQGAYARDRTQEGKRRGLALVDRLPIEEGGCGRLFKGCAPFCDQVTSFLCTTFTKQAFNGALRATPPSWFVASFSPISANIVGTYGSQR
jgi:hypothetical protein